MTDEQTPRIAAVLKLMTDPTRLRILLLLKRRIELNVTSIHTQLQLPQSTVSFKLRKLHSLGLVEYQRVGQRISYRLVDPTILSERAIERLFHLSPSEQK